MSVLLSTGLLLIHQGPPKQQELAGRATLPLRLSSAPAKRPAPVWSLATTPGGVWVCVVSKHASQLRDNPGQQDAPSRICSPDVCV